MTTTKVIEEGVLCNVIVRKNFVYLVLWIILNYLFIMV